MAKIEWLDNFAESFAKDMKMTKKAGKNITKESIIVNREIVKAAKLGDTINYNGKLYKVADLNFEDEQGQGAILDEVDEVSRTNELPQVGKPYEGINTDPMSISMGTDSTPFEGQETAQQYSRVDPGNVYDCEVPENYEQTAAETAQQIEKEKSVDRTTVPGHFTNPIDATPALVDLEIGNELPEIVETPELHVDNLSDETIDDVIDEDITAEDITDEEIESARNNALAGKRYNRILRRIMASNK